MPVILSQIAAKAGVSAAAVSKALNDHNDISAATKRRIKEIADDLGYAKNFAATSLVTRKTMTIGVLVAFPHIPTVIERIRGVQLVAGEHDYVTTVTFHDGSSDDEIRKLRLLLARVDGVVFTSTRTFPGLELVLAASDKPIVCMSEHVAGVELDYVGVDDAAGGRAAIEHLLGLGLREIVYLGDNSETPSDQAIVTGIAAVLSAVGITWSSAQAYWGNTDRRGTTSSVDRIIDSGRLPSAIFAFSDMAAIWALRRLRERGIDVPGDVAVVGFDGIEFAELAEVPLTSVSQPNFDIGCQAGRLLLDRLLGGDRKLAPRCVVFSPTLVARESTLGSE